MSNEAFNRGFAALLRRAGERAEQVTRKVALDLQKSMIEMSPVDTGRFRGNWQCGINQANGDTTSQNNSDAAGRTESVLQGWKPGQKIMLTNSLPYSRKLEYGHSSQAPQGIVRLTVQKYGEYLAAAARTAR